MKYLISLVFLFISNISLSQITLDCPTRANECIPSLVMDLEGSQQELYDKLKLKFYPKMNSRECDDELYYLQGRFEIKGFLGFKETILNCNLVVEVKENKIRLNFNDARVVWDKNTYYLEQHYNHNKGKWMVNYKNLIKNYEENLNNFVHKIRLDLENDGW